MRPGDTRQLLAILALAFVTVGLLGCGLAIGAPIGTAFADATGPLVLLAAGCGLGAVVGAPEDHDGSL